jgi:hypothetical protein
MDGLELSAVIAKLRASLSEAQNEGEGHDLRFLIDDITVELNVAVEDKAGVGGGVKFYVLSAKADASQTQTVTQKITLKLKPVNKAGNPFGPVGADGARDG